MSFFSLNMAGMADNKMEQLLSGVTDSLFSLRVTLGTVPIRCLPGRAAHAMA